MALIKLNSQALQEIPRSVFPDDTIVQVVERDYARNAHWSTSSSSDVAVSNWFVKITPKFSNSKIQCFASAFVHAQTNSILADVTIYRKIGSGSFSNLFTSHSNRITQSGSGADTADNTYETLNLQFEDSPNTTSEVTYQVYLKKASGGSGAFYLHTGGLNSFKAHEIKQ